MMQAFSILNRSLSILAAILPLVLLHRTIARGRSRGNTLFGVRVEQGFTESITGRAILKSFRHRLAWGALAVVAWTALSPITFAVSNGMLASWLIASAVFVSANRRTRREAQPCPEPSVRVASVSAEYPPGTWWLEMLDWAAMLVPPLIPAATLLFLAFHRDPTPTNFTGPLGVFPVFFGLTICLISAANQWALRSRARSSDWAPTPDASRKYRTYLGAMQSLVFTFIAGNPCLLIFMRFSSVAAQPSGLGMTFYFLIGFTAAALWLVLIWRIRFWLTKHLAKNSGDPMPDTCWKWGSVYFNPDDPALVVPARTGVGQSYNYARPSIWAAGAFLTVITAASVLQSVELLLRIDRLRPR